MNEPTDFALICATSSVPKLRSALFFIQ